MTRQATLTSDEIVVNRKYLNQLMQDSVELNYLRNHPDAQYRTETRRQLKVGHNAGEIETPKLKGLERA